MKEQRSRSAGDMVGSCVEMKTRAPRWRWRRIEERRVLVKFVASVVEFMYYERDCKWDLASGRG